MIELVTRKA